MIVINNVPVTNFDCNVLDALGMVTLTFDVFEDDLVEFKEVLTATKSLTVEHWYNDTYKIESMLIYRVSEIEGNVYGNIVAVVKMPTFDTPFIDFSGVQICH